MWNFTREEIDVLWQWAPIFVVFFVAAVRFLYFVFRRKDPHYQNWWPAEIVAVRSIVLICTGKPMTVKTWKSVNLVMVGLLALAVAAWVVDERTDGRYRMPVRKFLLHRLGITTATPARNNR